MTITEIRNVAIIAHVDHGKTTLVDGMLKQTHTFRENQKEMNQTLIMDSSDLEREKGITILSKNTSVFYKNTKINIIDTPGHADFGGEVERVLNMASGAILLVDAAEGPLPQTRFVLQKAFESKLKIILLINKIDKKDARPQEVLKEVENLFLDMAAHHDHLEFSVLYAVGREGKAWTYLPKDYTNEKNANLNPLFESIISNIPNSYKNMDKPFQMLISTLDYNNYVGKLCIGKVNQGRLILGENISLLDGDSLVGNYKSQKLYTSTGLERIEVSEVIAGDIVAIAGIEQMTIGQTVTHIDYKVALPKIKIEEPTIKVVIGPNTSPFSGLEGKLCSSAQIKERLLKEKETNLGMKVDRDENSSNFIVSGRGELHLAILIETMRREGFEMSVSKPQVIYIEEKGQILEPYEEITIDVDKIYLGEITTELAKRKAEMKDMTVINTKTSRLVYKIASRNFLGLRNSLLTQTRGTALINSFFIGYHPKSDDVINKRNGALIAWESGTSLSYGLENAQKRGVLFIGPGVKVYEGMVVGLSSRDKDMEINVCKGKKLTNVRSETSDIAIQLVPPVELTLEKALDIVENDELLEVTPKSLRIRKKILNTVKRRVEAREN
jgi:GTP-binding protein